MAIVELEDNEWQVVLGMMALAPWREANPLLMKIGQQLQAQQRPAQASHQVRQPGLPANGREAGHE